MVKLYDDVLAELNQYALDIGDSNINFKDLMAGDENTDITLIDGRVVPSIAKRLKQYIVSEGGPVLTVNGENGHVELTAEDVKDGYETQHAINSNGMQKIKSIEDLKNYKPLYDTQMIFLESYHSGYNQGGGWLNWFPLSVEIEDNYDIFASKVENGVWKRQTPMSDITESGILADGIDRTNEIVALLQKLKTKSIRRVLTIPRNVKFKSSIVYAASPVGIVLNIVDFTNFGQTNYLNKFNVKYSTDLVDDDTSEVLASNHHPALHLLNTGTSGTASATSRVASILHSVGISSRNDPINAQILQFGIKPHTTKWQTSIRALIPYDIALKDPVAWVTNKDYVVGDMCLSDGNKVYVVVTGGKSGNIAPSGTGTNITDGNVIWNFRANSRSIDTTVWHVDEDGNMGIAGASNTTFSMSGANSSRCSISLNSAKDVIFTDTGRSKTIISSTDTRGVHCPSGLSNVFTTINGATPTLNTGAGVVINATETTMTNILLPSGQTNASIILHFRDANTTIKNGLFLLKGGLDVTPPINGVMRFFKNSSLGGGWFEESRNF